MGYEKVMKNVMKKRWGWVADSLRKKLLKSYEKELIPKVSSKVEIAVDFS